MPLTGDDVDRFEACRPRLEAIAYRLLGSAAEAEDAVQEAFLRWHAADVERIEVPEAWLTKVLTNLCLNQLASARARRETYAGQWLPEPLLAGDPMLGPAETVEQRESVSYAVLTLMERLAPNERAVYVLREAFGYPHREIAEILNITEAASQQIFHWARKHLADGRARKQVADGTGRKQVADGTARKQVADGTGRKQVADGTGRKHDADGRARTGIDEVAARRIVEEFLAAAVSGRTEPLVRLLTSDATSIGDGGGKVPARAKAFEGAVAVARFLRGLFKPGEAKRAMAGGRPQLYAWTANGDPAVVAVVAGRVVGIMCLEVTTEGIIALRNQVHPDKLARATARWAAIDHGEPLFTAF